MAPRWLLRVALSAACGASSADAWGPEGHWITARVAGQLLAADVRDRAVELLSGEAMEDVASWADEFRSKPENRWSTRLHYINLPDMACAFVYDRDCKEDACVAGAIMNYTRRMEDGGLPAAERDMALKFVIHLMGDAHQPLHVSWKSDEGGNKIHVLEGFDHDKPENLHEVWDTGILEVFEAEHGFKMQGYAKMLLEAANATGPEVERWARCGNDLRACVLDVVAESAKLACASAYRDESGGLVADGEELTEAYYETRRDVVSARLTAGAVRLASVLTAVLKPEFIV